VCPELSKGEELPDPHIIYKRCSADVEVPSVGLAVRSAMNGSKQV
jgi:hypothetical protein